MPLVNDPLTGVTGQYVITDSLMIVHSIQGLYAVEIGGRHNLARLRELLRSRQTPKVRQVLPVLLGDEVLWFEQESGGYELTAGTRRGPL